MDNVPRMGYSGTLKGAEERQEPKASGKPSVEFDKLIDKVEAVDPEEQGKRRSGEEVEEDSELLAEDEGFAFSEDTPTESSSSVPVTIPDSQYWSESDDLDVESAPTTGAATAATEAVDAGFAADTEHHATVQRKPTGRAAKSVASARKLSAGEAADLALHMQQKGVPKPPKAAAAPQAVKEAEKPAKKRAPRATKKPAVPAPLQETTAEPPKAAAKPKKAAAPKKEPPAAELKEAEKPKATPRKRATPKPKAASPEIAPPKQPEKTKETPKTAIEKPEKAEKKASAPRPAEHAEAELQQPVSETAAALSKPVVEQAAAEMTVQAPSAAKVKPVTDHLLPGMAKLAHNTLERLSKHPVIMGNAVPALEVRPLPMPAAVEPPQPTATHQVEAIAPSVAVERIMNYVQAAVITLQSIPGRRELTITLRGDPKLKDTPLEGLRVTVTEFSSAPRQYNITLQASAQAQSMLNQHSENLLNSLQRIGQDRDWSVQRLEVETRRPLFHRKGSASGGDFGGQKR